MTKKENSASKLMSMAKFYGDYSRFNEETGTYESWEQAVERVMNMHKEKYAAVLTPELYGIFMEIQSTYNEQMFLGAQRALQFGGPQLLRKNAKMYNCVSSYADRAAFFGEFMWLLLCGAGAGFSVQRHHVAKLPALRDRKKSVKRFVVPDSIEGWAQAFDVLFSSFFVGGGKHPEFEAHPVWFDLSQIRPKGAKISGGFKAPGPEPLQHALTKVELLLSKVKNGTQLRPIEVYDACMYMADAVISGGVRRSATICLFSKDDEEMIRAKTGSWFQDNPQRGRSNNSVMLLRDEVTFEEFQAIMKSVEDSGEPGFIFTDSLEFTFNPCVEIGKLPVTEDGRSGWQGCNLSEINGGLMDTPEKFYRACYVCRRPCVRCKLATRTSNSSALSRRKSSNVRR
jgi:ribonucleoside-triphosphate reductase